MERSDVLATGLLAEFASPHELVAAARRAREAGLELLEAFTPYPVPEVEEVLALPPSPISRVVFVGAVLGAVFAYGLQYWVAVVAYPLLVGGMPPHSGPAFVPITFETTVLFGSLTAFFSLFAFTGLPRLWHPVFEAPGFESATIHRFWLGIDGRDPRFSHDELVRLLTAAGALSVVTPGVPS